MTHQLAAPDGKAEARDTGATAGAKAALKWDKSAEFAASSGLVS